MLIWLSRSEEDTYLFGKWIGSNTKAGDIILLFGQMGSGKTVLSENCTRSRCVGHGEQPYIYHYEFIFRASSVFI